MEGRREFIPREEGDPELTQSELGANADNRVLKFLKHAGMAAILGAAMLQAETAQAQELPSPEKQKMEEVKREFSDEFFVKILVESTPQYYPELEPFLEHAMIREVNPGQAGKFGETQYYVYLPMYKIVLLTKFNNCENELKSSSDEEKNKGIQEFTLSLIAALRDRGLIEIQRDQNGKAKIVPHYHGGTTRANEEPQNPAANKY